MDNRAAGVAAVLAAALPSLLAYNVSPSPTYLNQSLAFTLWAGFAAVAAGMEGPAPRSMRYTAPLLGALGILLLAAAWVNGRGGSATGLGLSVIGTVLAAWTLLLGGAKGGVPARRGQMRFAVFCWALALTGACNVMLALLQVFWPDLADGNFIATSGLPGRAVGNLRQPNHLSSLLLWGCIATVALHELKRLHTAFAAALLAAMVFAVVLTASRTGLVSVLLLALWALLDRRLTKPMRLMLLAAPLLYAISWWLMAQWAEASQHTFGGAARLAEGDISSSRFAIWRDTLALIRMHPWTGVGVGEFNFAWSLTPFPDRPTAFFDHAHNLPLQLLVELGLPLGGAVLALLLWALWRGLRIAFTSDGDIGVARRAAMLMVVMIGLHSLLEYPLWYSYFLLPTAWAWGFALAGDAPATPQTEAPVRRPWALRAAALLVIAGAVFSVFDYWRVATIFRAGDDLPPLAERIASGQKSVFFAHHADYAAVTSGVPVADPARAFDRATHYLLDTRLMIAWAESLAKQGELDKARHIAARLREFRNPDAAAFLGVCDAADAATHFQCQAPERVLGWRDFLPERGLTRKLP